MWVCPECKTNVSDDTVRCLCGYNNLKEFVNTKITASGNNSSDSDRYPVLNMISSGYKVLAWLIIPIVIFSIIITTKSLGELNLYSTGIILFYGFSAFITCYGISEGIRVFLDIEKNTRTR